MTQQEYKLKMAELESREQAHLGALSRIDTERVDLVRQRTMWVAKHAETLEYTPDIDPIDIYVNTHRSMWREFLGFFFKPGE